MNKTIRLLFILLLALVVLMIPLIAMQFTSEVKWSAMDFLVAGILLIAAALAVELVLRKIKGRRTKWIIVGFVFVILVLTWAELAVGIFGTPFAGN